MMPNWLVPVQFRIIPTNIENAIKLGKQLEMQYRVEVDDRDINEKKKLEDALSLKVPYIIRIGQSIEIYNYNTKEFEIADIEDLMDTSTKDNMNIFNQYSPLLLSQRIIG